MSTCKGMLLQVQFTFMKTCLNQSCCKCLLMPIQDKEVRIFREYWSFFRGISPLSWFKNVFETIVYCTAYFGQGNMNGTILHKFLIEGHL